MARDISLVGGSPSSQRKTSITRHHLPSQNVPLTTASLKRKRDNPLSRLSEGSFEEDFSEDAYTSPVISEISNSSLIESKHQQKKTKVVRFADHDLNDAETFTDSQEEDWSYDENDVNLKSQNSNVLFEEDSLAKRIHKAFVKNALDELEEVCYLLLTID